MELACVACGLDPQTTGLVIPLAQAAAVAGPFLLRREIARQIARLRAWREARMVGAGRAARRGDTMAPRTTESDPTPS